MSSLQPARTWEFLKRDKRVRLPEGYHESWYPTPASIEFMSDFESMGNRARRIVDAWFAGAIKKARRDPNAFIELVSNGFDDDDNTKTEWIKQGWIHKEIQRLFNYGSTGTMANGIVAKHRKCAIAVPRGIGKTTQVLWRCLWEMGHNPDIKIMIVCETDIIARKRVREIKGHIEKNKWLHMIFPNLKPGHKDQWTDSRIIIKRPTVSKDATVEGSGVLASGTGNRCDLLIGDDVVGARNALIQAKLRDEVIRAWEGLWEPTLTRGGRIWFIFTPWHHSDLCHSVVKRDDFITMIASVGQDFETPWPERWSQEKLRSMYTVSMLKSAFARAYFLEASDSKDQPIDVDLIQFFDPATISSEGLIFVLSFDLAIGKKKDSDYFAGIISAIDTRTNDIYILDFINEHLPFPKQVKKVRSLVNKYSPRYVLVETVAYQEALAQMVREDLGRYPKVISFKPTVDKLMRMELAAPPLENGGAKFSEKLEEKGSNPKGLLMRQLRDFGIAPHDDVADALTQLILWATDKFKMTKKSTLKAYTLG